MLPDKERKMLNILSNFSTKHNRMPNMNELWKKTGLPEGVLRVTLRSLAEKSYIKWDDNKTDSIQLHKEWRYMVQMEQRQLLTRLQTELQTRNKD